MRKRLVIYCEGQTEQFIVERVLRNHLSLFGVKVERPILGNVFRSQRTEGRVYELGSDRIRFA